MDKKEWKATKKAYKKAKHKATRPWKGLAIFSGIFGAILVVVTLVLGLFDNTIALLTGDSFWTLKNEDKSAEAQYFSADADLLTETERVDKGYEVARQVEEEGAALLYNKDNNALPLAKSAKVTLMSNNSVDVVYGGTGSGNVDTSEAHTLREALELSDFEVNETMWDFYNSKEAQEYASSNDGGVSLSAATVSEIPWDKYPQDAIDSIAQYGDAAIVTISRIGGEGADLDFGTVNYLALDDNEKDLLSNLQAMKKDGKISKVVMLINSSNALQMDFMKDNTYDIDAVLWIGGVGIAGLDAVGEILCGTVNPSGGLVDTYCYDNYSSPAMKNNRPTKYDGDLDAIPDSADTYEIYQEGIYVGYKYYETRYEDYVMDTGNAGDYKYADTVAYPFGFGLSYTTFELFGMNVVPTLDGKGFDIAVNVKNTGTVPGKQTVEIYAQSPYTQYDKDNGIEKASVSLVGFGKTQEIEPGLFDTVVVYVDKADLASYDANDAKTYILDKGTYYFTAATDAHEATNNILAAKGYNQNNTASRMTANGNVDVVKSYDVDVLDATTCATSKAGVAITNQLDSSDINKYEGRGDNKVTYLSRDNWTDTFPKDEITQLSLTDQMIKDLQLVLYNADDYDNPKMPTLNEKNGYKLYDMIGKTYDDPTWEKLLNQLSYDDMVSLVGDAFHWTMPIESVQAPGTRDENGPQGLTVTLFGSGLHVETTAFTSEDVMAATFNTTLMSEVGRIIGNDCLAAKVSTLYGPGNNIHRTPYGGRNFEYYSEDGFLSGKISAYEVASIEAKGVHVVMKHFALNDSEQDRIGLGVWLNEQSAREIYLKAFQDAFEEGNAGGTMVAYTRWGCVWSGADKGLMTGIMREEWGSNGLTITDNVLTQYVNGVDGVMAGGVTCYDAMLWYVTSQLPKYENDPVVVSALKEACHHDLYSIANSCAMNGIGKDTIIKATTPGYLVKLRVAMWAFVGLFALTLTLDIVKKVQFKKSNPKPKKSN